MKLTLEQHEDIITIETPLDYLTATETLRLMIRLCHASEFASRSIEEAILELADEIEER
jgi:hypothetical protein